MRTLGRRFIGLWLLLLVLAFVVFGLRTASSYAASLTVGEWSPPSGVEANVDRECSVTEACAVILTLEYGGSASTDFSIEVGGVSTAGVSVNATSPKANVTVLVAAGQKWQAHTSALNGATVSESHSALAASGIEGKEGKEGPPGPEGKEGKAGSEGKTEVTGFGQHAEATMTEGVETVEAMGYSIMGLLLGGGVIGFALRWLGPR